MKLNEGRTCSTVSVWRHEDFLPKLLPVDLTTSLKTSEISFSFQYCHSLLLKITTPMPKILKDKEDVITFLDPTDKLFFLFEGCHK